MHYIIGLGNPGLEYEKSRHNTGRQAVEFFNKAKPSKKIKTIDSFEYMNNSGKAVGKVIKSKKTAQDLIVVYDDIDLALGTIKISWNKGSGGHKGLESVVKALKTKEFVRIRIGIAPATPSGKIKKPEGEEKILDFILGKFKPAEEATLKKVFKIVAEAIETIVEEGKDRAMNRYN